MKAEDSLMDLTGLTVGEVGVANMQAEISFPLGEQEGIRKVVEWVNERCLEEMETEHYYDVGGADKGKRVVGRMIAPNYSDWKTKLKEWGL